MTELLRLIRHLWAPVVVWLVARGWLPEWAQHDITEAGVVLIGILVPLVWSWWRERGRGT